MNRIALMLTLLAALCVAVPGQAYLIRRVEPDDTAKQEIARLAKELRQAKLGQMALLIDRYSEGKSRLLIGLGARAEPKVPVFVRSPATQKPFVAVYPASYPVTAELLHVGTCELLGAVALGVDATAPRTIGAGDERIDIEIAAAEPDVYLLAYMLEGPRPVIAPRPGEVVLVSMAVGDDGRTKFGYLVSTPGQRFDSHSGRPRPGATVKFPPKGKASKDDPPWRAHARMVWRDVGYEFALDFMPVGDYKYDL